MKASDKKKWLSGKLYCCPAIVTVCEDIAELGGKTITTYPYFISVTADDMTFMLTALANRKDGKP